MSANNFNASVAKLQHAIWKNKLITFLNGGESVTAVGHRECELGQWIYKKGGLSDYGSLLEMQQLEKYHAQFHDKTKQVIDSYTSGDIDKAWGAYEDIKSMSDKIIQIINALEAHIKQDSVTGATLSKEQVA